ncbi:hypothetical protein ACHAXT_007412 [Thalassiosira profunda]
MRRPIAMRAVGVVLAAAASSAFNLPKTPASIDLTSNPQDAPSHHSPLIAAAPIAIAALLFSFAPPSMAVEGDITKGKEEIFEGTCRGCHMGGNNLIKEKKTLKKDALEQFVGLEQEKVEAFFRGSLVHKGPTIGGKLSDQEIVDVTTFVVDQAVNEKW